MKDRSSNTPDALVIGGGVIGLTLARELASQGIMTTLIDRGPAGRAASWAGAGILPPSSLEHARHPIEKMAAESFRLHPELASRLLEETGIDNGFRRCGAVFIARTAGELAALNGQCGEWRDSGVVVQQLPMVELLGQLPALADASSDIRLAVLVPDEAQIRNPDHLQALATSCRGWGVTIKENVGEVSLESGNRHVTRVTTESGESLSPERVCIAAGAWSQTLLQQLEYQISTLPVRGQMLLYKLPKPVFSQVLYEGTRYIVPRDDGHVLAGSTLEQAGFDATTTPEAIDDLKSFASSLFAELTADRLIDAWAGLRPATFDGFPYVGRVPGFENAWSACGHFRSGLLLSTSTAIVTRQLMLGETPMFDLSPFRLDRG